MGVEVEYKLESGFQKLRDNDYEGYLGFLIVKKEENPQKFFQFSVSERNSSLDFPVLDVNDNTEEECRRILDTVDADKEDVTEGPADGNGVNIDLEANMDLVGLSKEIIKEIWGDGEHISVETGR